MRTFQLRTYTLRSAEALRLYAETIYPRHLRSMPLFGVQLHGFWTKKEDATPRLFALVSYSEGDDPEEVDNRYLKSAELADDTKGFDMDDITSVVTIILVPSTGSPLS